MQNIDADKILLKNFFEAYTTISGKLTLRRAKSDLSSLSHFMSGFTQVNKLALKLISKTSPYYNVFHILNIGTYETRLHTPFLCNLLDPGGSHSQGRLFIDEIFRMLLGEDVSTADIHSIQVVEEMPTQLGRIDIYISYMYGNEKRAIVIENKIYAKDQKDQLDRYYAYLRNTIRLSDRQLHLIYLTPGGREPEIGKAIGEVNYKRMLNKELRIWSYSSDIDRLLSRCMHKIEAPLVCKTVLQYQSLIKSL